MVTLLEPLSMYVIILIADSTLVFARPWENWVKWEYAAFLLSFWVGFSLRAKRVHQRPLAISPIYLEMRWDSFSWRTIKKRLELVIIGNDSGFGPNVQYFIQADLFFNSIGGVLYSCLLG
jgi:hypothetical protein